MDIKRRFKLINKIQERLDVEFTDIQLEFLLEDTNYHSVCYQMPRQSGKDFITQIRIVIRILEELEDGNYLNMMIVSNNEHASSQLMSKTVDILVKMLPIQHSKFITIDTPGNKYLEVHNIRIYFKPLQFFGINGGSCRGIRINEAIINEFGTLNLKDIIDSLRVLLLDKNGPLFLIGTLNPNSLLFNSVNNVITKERKFDIKREDDNELDLPTVFDEMQGTAWDTIETGSISIRPQDFRIDWNPQPYNWFEINNPMPQMRLGDTPNNISFSTSSN